MHRSYTFRKQIVFKLYVTYKDTTHFSFQLNLNMQSCGTGNLPLSNWLQH